jgi:hypothetical protein
MDTQRIDNKLGEISQWQSDHQEDDERAHKEIFARFDIMESNISLLPTKEEIANIVRAAMLDSLLKTGKSTKAILITVAAVMGSLVIIGGGFKWLLGLIGFTYMK